VIECSPLSAIGGWLMDLGLLISQLLSSTVDVTSVVSLDKKWLFFVGVACKFVHYEILLRTV